MNIFKKDTEKHTNKLPMTGKVRKGFRIYCTAIMGAALILGHGIRCRRPHHRRQQPVQLHLRADSSHRSYPAGLRRGAGRLVPQVPRPVPASQRLSDPCGRRHHYLCQGDPRPDRRLSKPYRGAFPDFRGRPDSLKGGAFRERQLGRTEP